LLKLKTIALGLAIAASTVALAPKPALADWNTPWFTVDLGWGTRNQQQADAYCDRQRFWFSSVQAEDGQWYSVGRIKKSWAHMQNKKCMLNLWW
jgi:hypothetical protein